MEERELVKNPVVGGVYVTFMNDNTSNEIFFIRRISKFGNCEDSSWSGSKIYKDKKYEKSNSSTSLNQYTATKEEIAWLEACETAGRFVEKGYKPVLARKHEFRIGDEVCIPKLGTYDHTNMAKGRIDGSCMPSDWSDAGTGVIMAVDNNDLLIKVYKTTANNNKDCIVLWYKKENVKSKANVSQPSMGTNQINTSKNGKSNKESIKGNIIKTDRLVQRVSRGQRPSGNAVRGRASRATIKVRPLSYSVSAVKS